MANKAESPCRGIDGMRDPHVGDGCATDQVEIGRIEHPLFGQCVCPHRPGRSTDVIEDLLAQKMELFVGDRSRVFESL